jgi:hypothetical protein
VLIEAISFITFVTKAVALSTGDIVLSHHHDTSLPQRKVAFMHLGAFLARGNFGDIIFDEEVQNSIGVSSRSHYTLP